MNESLRIAQISPLAESVPPRGYGGTERVVSYLTEELVRRGHQVTLYATADSYTSARLVPGSPAALRDACDVTSQSYLLAMCEHLIRDSGDYDIIHAHIDLAGIALSRRLATPMITTLHGRLDIPALQPFFREFHEAGLVSISDNQRLPLPHAHWLGTVYHGLPQELSHPYPDTGEYLAFIGRFSPEKRVDSAIDIACAAGYPIKIAAKIDNADYEYYCDHIKPRLKRPGVEFIGEVGEADKAAFLGRALGLIFAVDWPEPFGLALIEAMSFGTPVLARQRGSIPELVEEGITGFIFDRDEEAITKLPLLEELDRHQVFTRARERFSAARMADDYLTIYHQAIAAAHKAPQPTSSMPLFSPSR